MGQIEKYFGIIEGVNWKVGNNIGKRRVFFNFIS